MRIFIFLLAFILTTQAKSDTDAGENLCLALNMYFEDRQHEEQGMRGVAWVTLNRYNDIQNRWPKTICGVVYEPSYLSDKPYKCAFSWTCDKIDDRIEEPEQYYLAWNIAKRVLSGEDHYDPTFGALYYYRCDLHGRDQWMKNLQFTTRIGKHCFYKDK